MTLPTDRELNRLWAESHGLFWIPCPLCGREFGGHEWRRVDGKSDVIYREADPRMGTGICPDCTAAGLGEDLRCDETWGIA